MTRTCQVVRVFTRAEVGGNHLGVVQESDGLGTSEMQAIASDLGFSETIFLTAGDPPSVRIFTPGREMPFAGHPLVGITWVLNQLSGLQPDRLLCGIGEVRVGYSNKDAWVEVSPERPVRSAPTSSAVASQLGLATPVSGAWVDMPVPYLLLELESAGAVEEADFAEEVLDSTEVGELYIYAWSGQDRVKARFFAPEAGVFEDPATGSAAVALAAKLAGDGLPVGQVVIDQGDEMGHPSSITLDWDTERVRIGGSVVYVEDRDLDV